MTNFDQKMIRECLTLAKKALGKTSPNPLVGAVVVKNGQIVGRGFHPQAGLPHAEVFALKEAGEEAMGATIYVNLEPCNHYGKTPPCTEAIIQAGISQVVVGMVDPDERVAGGGIRRLMSAGIDVKVGVEEEACGQLNEAFIHRVIHKRPFGILKYAMTMDGKIATATGDSKWITGQKSRDYVHFLRSSCDAVVVGGNTVRKDNPRLTTHGVSRHNPLRVVMSASFDLPFDCNLWDTAMAATVVYTLPQGDDSALKAHLLARGVEVLELENLCPTVVMDNLYHRGFNSIFWECGGILGARAIASGNIQKVLAFMAPKIIGGQQGFNPVGDLGITAMKDALSLQNITLQRFDDDFLIEGYIQ
ncbi:bifunctional diaminohydroxyphosphoribosylaminopyrimidine deaminase/5-amino-6-(5-phosphoribosylamino)uracil reductase RibD [Cyanobacterium sp. IPPAS B-1200]|uniref:bifunctional diaminohydroxyphosphoribosylaminopyrimidine deaminase/5-amino-6-(5-phosphoribosylamino)uracil reductase RibD n=1 Tax=Cyanobacterium sp. IPPAS B-1200 TaxID=1562720 RepID=UPI0008525DFB|nr:bifunctional diaminohydroxyphosphoribosylaminopyrimidine deaminase/5-amino-6-(5-phosphoribosylamino)uracil reductase RibD [Cyanobacterium sp. IPPAS B-1200]OEJ77533.1 bifunctional diaminohydroxyphosphoribosylaminopyrimidine deaminase/5-amino-6-(5-phosphoribosylamino)uracil reductase [Cyanobacterium sp. IPPAS B-1200]